MESNPITMFTKFCPFLITAAVGMSLVGCSQPPAKQGAPNSVPKTSEPVPNKTASKSGFEITSPAFNNGESIPARFSCSAQGGGVSPPFNLASLPQAAKTVVLIAEDPDAPKGTFTHWMMWNWPVSEREIPAAIGSHATLENGAVQGKNSAGKVGYFSLCPPSGVHRYFFTAYALDGKLKLSPDATKAKLQEAMKGHILAQSALQGTFHHH